MVDGTSLIEFYPVLAVYFFFKTKVGVASVAQIHTAVAAISFLFFSLVAAATTRDTNTHTHTHTQKEDGNKKSASKEEEEILGDERKTSQKNKILGAGTENKTAPRPAVTCKML